MKQTKNLPHFRKIKVNLRGASNTKACGTCLVNFTDSFYFIQFAVCINNLLFAAIKR